MCWRKTVVVDVRTGDVVWTWCDLDVAYFPIQWSDSGARLLVMRERNTEMLSSLAVIDLRRGISPIPNTPAWSQQAQWSPQNDEVLFTGRPGGMDGDVGVYVARRAARGPALIAALARLLGVRASDVPGDFWIFFMRSAGARPEVYTNSVWITRRRTGGGKEIVPHTWGVRDVPSVSPDGTRLAWVKRAQERRPTELLVYSWRSGRAPTRVTVPDRFCWQVLWRPDGRTIFCVGATRCWVYDTENGELEAVPTELVPKPHFPAEWLPDCQRVLIEQGSAVWLINLELQTAQVLYDFEKDNASW